MEEKRAIQSAITELQAEKPKNEYQEIVLKQAIENLKNELKKL